MGSMMKAIEMYNRLHPGKKYRFSEFAQDIKKNLLDIPKASDKSKLAGTRDFIDWTGRYPRLVYALDWRDPNGVVHHRGDSVESERMMSNYTLAATDNNGGLYAFAPDQGE